MTALGAEPTRYCGVTWVVVVTCDEEVAGAALVAVARRFTFVRTEW